MRWIEKGELKVKKSQNYANGETNNSLIKLYPFGISKGALETLIKDSGASIKVIDNESNAKIFLTTKSHYARKPKALENAQNLGISVHVLRKNTKDQLKKFLEKYSGGVQKIRSSSAFENNSSVNIALEEVHYGIKQIFDGEHRIELNAQNSFIRRLQHKAATKEGISSISIGEGSNRRVVLEKVL